VSDGFFDTDISAMIWESRFRHRMPDGGGDRDIRDSWRRVARAAASVETRDRQEHEQRFLGLMEDFRFLPAGRILAGADTGQRVTLLNCFVMGRIRDSMEGIFDALKEGVLTMQLGGGVGYDFSTLRPAGAAAARTGHTASGPVSFMHIWDTACETLLSSGPRRGAMMATLRCDHPDIETFIDAKREAGKLHNFNLSVLVSDAFMEAVHADAEWPLLFPAKAPGPGDDDTGGAVPGRVFRRVRARDLWRRIALANYDTAEPGVLFIDRINRENNLGYREQISATNPCGEIPLPPYGACNLGSLNLTRLVRAPFTSRARLDLEALAALTTGAVRLLDNIIDRSRYPLPQQQEQASSSRRIGLGVTGLADALIMLGLHYGSDEARQQAALVMKTVCHSAYRASASLAGEKGAYPLFEAGACLQQPFIRRLPDDIRRDIARGGLRNSHLIAIAPAGTISLLANNISGGIEPVFDFEYRRRVRDTAGDYRWYDLQDYALRRWRAGHPEGSLPGCFVSAQQLAPREHLAMQAAVQPFVDNAVSKTINVPPDCGLSEFESLYDEAYRLGLKGCTTYRPNTSSGAVLESRDSCARSPAAPCPGAAAGLAPNGFARGTHSGPVPAIRMGDVAACLVNGVFGDPLLKLRLLHQRRVLLFDLGDAGRISARVAHQVSDIFLSHTHADHIGGFMWFLRTRVGPWPACRIFGPAGTARQIAGMVDGILWDRAESRGPRFEVREWHDGRLRCFAVNAGAGSAQETGSCAIEDGVVWREPGFTVRATQLDHGTPVLAYAFEPRARLNICRERLEQLGLGTGPWLQELKREYLAGHHTHVVALPNGASATVGELAERFMLVCPGQKLVYATDFADTADNRRRLVDLARDAHSLFCEAAFMLRHADQARLTRHLTTEACAAIANQAGVRHLLPFHFSKRYIGDLRGLYGELTTRCPNTVVPTGAWQYRDTTS
jgi:ribonucleoside-diphosphate reductase alpha chain